MKTELRNRLVTFIKYLGLSQSAFLKSVGLSKGYMKKVNTYITPKTIDKILSVYPRLNTEWLLTGKDTMIILAPREPKKNETKKLIQNLPQDNKKQLTFAEEKTITDSTDSTENVETNTLSGNNVINNYAPQVKLIRDTLFGGSNRKFAEKMGITPNIISMWCTVRAGNVIVNKIIQQLPQIDKNWLLTGIGSMTLKPEQITSSDIKKEEPKKTSFEQRIEALIKLTEQNANSLDKLIAIIEKEKKEKEDLIKEKNKLQKEKTELFELLNKYSSHTQQYKTPVRELPNNYTIKVKENNNGKKI